MKSVLIIGAQNIDIFANVDQDIILQDSNIATMSIHYGGVGRNIAETVKRLVDSVDFLTVVGNDLFQDSILDSLQDSGFSSELVYRASAVNSFYMGVLDKNKDLYLGLNDMRLLQELPVSFFKQKHDIIESFDILVLDNNLSEQHLQYLLRTYQHKTIVMDGVSTKKVLKISEYLSYIDVLKVNQLELASLSRKSSIEARLQDLINRGANHVVCTQQDKTIYYQSLRQKETFQPIPIDTITNATGAGDAFVSGMVYGIAQDVSVKEWIAYGSIVSYFTLQVKGAVDTTLRKEKVDEYYETIY